MVTGDLYSYLDEKFRVNTSYGALNFPKEDVLYITFVEGITGEFEESTVIFRSGDRIAGKLLRYSSLDGRSKVEVSS